MVAFYSTIIFTTAMIWYGEEDNLPNKSWLIKKVLSDSNPLTKAAIIYSYIPNHFSFKMLHSQQSDDYWADKAAVSIKR